MQTTSAFWELKMRDRIAGLCAALAALAFIPSAQAKPTYITLPDGTIIYSINDGGAVTGTQYPGAFLRTPDGTITTFNVPGDTRDIMAKASTPTTPSPDTIRIRMA